MKYQEETLLLSGAAFPLSFFAYVNYVIRHFVQHGISTQVNVHIHLMCNYGCYCCNVTFSYDKRVLWRWADIVDTQRP